MQGNQEKLPYGSFPKTFSLLIPYQSVRLSLLLQTSLESNSQICISGKRNDSVLLIDLYFTL